jgi:hypothetical protein
MIDLTREEIESIIWLELVNREYDTDFMSWLLENFDITPKK